MILRRQKTVGNRRRSGSSRRRSQGLLEVKVRADIAQRQRSRAALVWLSRAVLAVGLVVGVAMGGRALAERLFTKNPAYNLAVVELPQKPVTLTRDFIMATAGLRLGQNLFDNVSLSRSRDALAALPQVERVEVTRELPNKIIIDLTERAPVAWLAPANVSDPSSSEAAFLIDASGALFKPNADAPREGTAPQPKHDLPDQYLRLPAVYGTPVENYMAGQKVETPEIAATLELLQKNTAANGVRILSLDVSSGYSLVATVVVTASRRSKITFGFGDNVPTIAEQLKKLQAVIDYVEKLPDKELASANLIPRRHIPLVLVAPTEETLDMEPGADEASVLAQMPLPKMEAVPSPGAVAKPSKTGTKAEPKATSKPLRAEGSRDSAAPPPARPSASLKPAARQSAAAAATPAATPARQASQDDLRAAFRASSSSKVPTSAAAKSAEAAPAKSAAKPAATPVAKGPQPVAEKTSPLSTASSRAPAKPASKPLLKPSSKPTSTPGFRREPFFSSDGQR